MTDTDSHNVLREGIVPFIQEDVWFQDAALQRVICELTELRDRMDRFDDQRLLIVGELAELLGRHPRLLVMPKESERTRAMRALALNVSNLRQRLLVCYKSFLRNSYRRYLPSDSGPFVHEGVKDFRETLTQRFQSIIEPDIKKTLDMMREFIGRIRKGDNQ
jgi:hypothetical protein